MSKNQLAISSNTLFHFTNKRKNVISILDFGFRPHYCLENLNFIFGDIPEQLELEEFKIAFPMVCFCDLTLSHTKNHMKNYGEYGIGLSKKWGIENKVSPVLYIHNASKVFDAIKKIGGIVDEKHRDGVINDNLKSIIFGHLHEIYSMIKPYEGKLRNEKIANIIRFYDEREWRFVPQGADGYGMPKIDFSDQTQLKKYNDEIWKKVVIPFKPSDIKYIIVPKEKQIVSIIHEIERSKNNYSLDEKKLLCSRVISAEQIYEDF